MLFKAQVRPWIQYIIVVLLVCYSGSEPFSGRGGAAEGRNRELLIAFFTFLAPLYFLSRNSRIAPSDLAIFFLFLAILFAQAVLSQFFPLATNIGFMIRLFIGFAAVRLVADFPRAYINVIYGISLISFVFYIPRLLFHALGKDFTSLFTPIVHLVQRVFLFCCDQHVLLYNFQSPRGVYRNAGIFWEPGAFAGFLLVGLIFLGLQKSDYGKQFYRHRFILLTVALLTTLSSMGYAVYPIVLGLHSFWPKAKTVAGNLGWVVAVLAASPLLLVGATKIWNLDFVGPKVIENYVWGTTASEFEHTQSRFGGLVWKWKYIVQRPVVGWGLNARTRYALDRNDQWRPAGGDGISDFVVSFGLLGLGAFGLATWMGLYTLSGHSVFRTSLAMAAILLMLIGQKFLYYPLFLGFMFLQKRYDKTAKRSVTISKDHMSGAGLTPS